MNILQVFSSGKGHACINVTTQPSVRGTTCVGSRPTPYLKFCQEMLFVSAHETPLNHRLNSFPLFSNDTASFPPEQEVTANLLPSFPRVFEMLAKLPTKTQRHHTDSSHPPPLFLSQFLPSLSLCSSFADSPHFPDPDHVR